ncbi:unnamed protein product [Blepharisma stoltei]|uniref:Myb-like DNA-binding domain containing protein n=1 Tax=Blepharisma stoltei TaxID=1481888 RepID=A0AAU9JQ75_9CILI|nr:unnamed protein product [Blepharisma stoltei]
MNPQQGFKYIIPRVNYAPMNCGLLMSFIPVYAHPFSAPVLTHPQPLQPQNQILTESKPKYKRTWKREQIEKLYVMAQEYCEKNDKKLEDLTHLDFLEIAKFTDKTPEQCQAKIYEIMTSGTLRSGIWSDAEDELLKQLLLTKTVKWGLVANELNTKIHKNIKIRTGKQCKERWNNHLNPNINRGDWSQSEDLKLLELHKEHGNHWSLIAKGIVTRTESAIKNRIKSLKNKEMQDLSALSNPSSLIDRLIVKKKMDIPVQCSIEEPVSPQSGIKLRKASGDRLSFSGFSLELASTQDNNLG